VVFLAGAVSGVVALVLLHRSGFLSRRTQAENPQLNREFFRYFDAASSLVDLGMGRVRRRPVRFGSPP